ncbi:MAG: hypothetical protein Q9170_001242 [Blastenia crenularia]
MALRFRLLETVDAFVSAYNSWDMEAIMDVRAPDCMNLIFPVSLGLGPMNNKQYFTYFNSSLAAFQNFHLEIRDVTIDETARKVVLNATSTASTAVGEYQNEYILTLHMTEDGRKIAKFEEFVDSKYSADFMPKLRKSLSRPNIAKI